MSEESLSQAIKDAIDYHTALIEESDRAAAILVVADFEEWLKGRLLSKFRELDDDLMNELFGDYGPLNSFKAKIDIAFAFKFFDQDVRKGLLNVKTIRNRFAHLSEPMTFEHDMVRDLCRNLESESCQGIDDLRVRLFNYLLDVQQMIDTNMYPELNS